MTSAGLLCALGSGLLAGTFPTVYGRQGPEKPRQVGLQIAAYVLTASAACVCLYVCGLKPGGPLFLGLAVLWGLANTVNNYTYFGKALHLGPVSISWAVVYLTSVTVPIMGWVFLREPVRFWQIGALLCIMLCLAVMAVASRRTAQKRGGELAPRGGYWLWLILALGSGTAAGFLMACKDRLPGEVIGHDASFLMAGFTVCGAVLFTASIGQSARPVYDRRTWGLAAAAAGLTACCLLLILMGLRVCPSSEFFPVQSGSALISGLVLARLRGERPSRLAYLGAALAAVAIVLINLGGRPIIGSEPPARAVAKHRAPAAAAADARE